MKDSLKITSPLTNLRNKTTKFEWSDKCEDALTTTPILTFPIEGKEYTFYSDASKNGLGCVLIYDDKVVAYASRKL